jgi:protein phosphatase-4 regulatory subunit 3
MGCTFIWDQICSVQRSINFPNVTGLNGSVRPGGDDLEHSGTSQDDGGTEGFELPPVELANLPQIAKALAEVSPFEKDRVASLVVRDQNYIRKLVEMFRTCEDLENDEGLHYMYKIVKGIISLNDGNIFDIIFSDEFIMDNIGALEYDPELTTRQNHRTYLTEQVTFKEAVPIHDRAVLSKIHQTYRIGYIKDVILPRVLDDQTFATMNSIILFNNVSVVTSLQNDSAFLSELFSKLRSPETPEKNRRDLVFFIQEFCNLSKHLQPGVRSQLLSALAKEGLFDIVKDILNDAEESVRLSGCDILIVILNNDPALLRSFLVHQTSHALFSELVTGMLTPSEGGLQAQLLEIMRMLLDSETMDATQVEKSPFLEIFYEKYMDQMVEVLTSGCPPEPGALVPSKESDENENKSKPHVTPEILGNICELLCFCVQHHRFRIKYYVMRKHVVEKVLRLTRRKEKYLVVAAVRFLRTCISLKEEFYYRYIVKNNCFEPIISAFVANGNRYNLLNSAVLDIIDCIRKDGIKSLIVHLIDTYSSKLESIDYVDTFRALKLKYDQLLESPSGFAGGAAISGGPDHGSRGDKQGQGGVPESRKRKDERALDKDEEDYFNEDSDDEEDTLVAGNMRASSGLKSANAGTLNKPRTPSQRSLSDDEEDTASAKLRTSAGQQSPKAVILISKNIALSNVPYRGNMFGLVDYEDEEDDIPMNNLGSNGKDDGGGKVLEKESDSLLTSIPLSDPIWSNLESDATVAKRKFPPTPDLEQQNDAVLLKRQKPQGAIERSSDVRGTLTSIDDSSEELAFSTGRNAEVLESAAELLTKRPDTEEPKPKIEEPKPASANGTVVSVSESNHIVGGDGAEDLSCPNGKVSNTLSRDPDCANRIANGSTDSASAEVAISSGGHEDPNLHNGIRGGDGNGVNSDDNGIGQDCNGVKRDGSVKVTSELSNGSSLDSENKQKMTSLSTTELHSLAVTPTSPGPFTVR